MSNSLASPQGLMLFVEWGMLPKATQAGILAALGKSVGSEAFSAQPTATETDSDFASCPLTLAQTRELFDGLDKKTEELIRAIASHLDGEGCGFIACTEAEIVTESDGPAAFAKGPLAGLHRRLRTITGDKNSKLISKYRDARNGYESYFIDHPQTIESLRTYLKISPDTGPVASAEA